ncbi:MAG: TIGR04423 family type III CRISPR-associated protein [Candidatus Cloacimonadales bacterium]|nr:TIGR04423 family type III CRISPR-associated protein [Candidatus Cloacimonadales bacterium]
MNNRFMPIDKLSDIPKKKYTGYLWKSNSPTPDVLNASTYDFSNIEENPFIIEGYLYSESENFSISIKQIDGQYFISKIDLAEIDLKNPPKDEITPHCYLSDPAIFKKNNDFKYIKFIEFWEEKEDNLCENMKVLKPAWIAFLGFCKEVPNAK